ncbi:MAG: hypothetical protein QXU00_00140 [Ignisphaera sp.]
MVIREAVTQTIVSTIKNLKTIETYTISYTSTVFGIMKQTTTIIEIVK